MLHLFYNAETPGDIRSPINIASALTQDNLLSTNDLIEIAEHLIAYTKRIQLEEKRAGIDI